MSWEMISYLLESSRLGKWWLETSWELVDDMVLGDCKDFWGV